MGILFQDTKEETSIKTFENVVKCLLTKIEKFKALRS